MACPYQETQRRVVPAQPLPKGRITIDFGLRCDPCKGPAIPGGPRLAKFDCAVAERYLIYRIAH
jgi:hypothetical protein